MKKTTIIISVILGIGLVAFVGFWLFNRNQGVTDAASLDMASVERGDLAATIGASGVVHPNQSATLSWRTSGTVGEVLVEIDQAVEAGQVLADLAVNSLAQNIILAQSDLVSAEKALDELKSSSLQQAQAQKAVEDAQEALDDLRNPQQRQAQALQAIANAEKAVKDAQYQLDNFTIPSDQVNMSAMEAVVVLKAKLDEARTAFEPYRYYDTDNPTREDLQEELSIAQSNFNTAVRRLDYEYQLQAAQANLDKAIKDYEKLENGPNPGEVALLEAQLADALREAERLKDGPTASDIAAAEARVSAAQATLDQARVTAPFAGVITRLFNQPGDQVSPTSPAFRLDDLSRLLVDVQVSEIDINQIKPGQLATLVFDAILDKEYQGRVITVEQVGEANQGVVNFNATVELLDADELVKPGMTASVNIILDQKTDALLVPVSAVQYQNGTQLVYVVRNNQIVPVEVEVGSSSDLFTEIASGDLQEGETILLYPPDPEQGMPTFGDPGEFRGMRTIFGGGGQP